MATSGSTDFNLVANEIIEEAFDLCGIGTEGEAITADQYARGRRSLNLLIKTWSAKEHLWLKTESSVTLVSGQATYALASLFTSKPMRVLSVRRRNTDSSLDVPLMEEARSDYFDRPNKSATGTPVNFYYDPQTTTGTLYIWQPPSAAVASDYTLQVTWLRRMDDFDTSSDDADLPQEWLQALAYGLAEQLALKYGVAPDVRMEIAQRAAQLKAEMNAWDNEPASLHLMPETRWC